MCDVCCLYGYLVELCNICTLYCFLTQACQVSDKAYPLGTQKSAKFGTDSSGSGVAITYSQTYEGTLRYSYSLYYKIIGSLRFN